MRLNTAMSMPHDTSGNNAARHVPCPTCGNPSLFAPANPYRPFCCLRCRQIDLGAWASEDFRVAAQTPPQDET